MRCVNRLFHVNKPTILVCYTHLLCSVCHIHIFSTSIDSPIEDLLITTAIIAPNSSDDILSTQETTHTDNVNIPNERTSGKN